MQYLPVYYLGHLIDVLNEQGIPIDTWLAQNNIDEAKLYSSNSKIVPEEFDRLLTQILQHKQTQHLGLTIGRKLQIAHHGTFGLAILNCENLSQIIEFFKQYLQIRIPFIEINTIQNKTQLIVLARDTHWQGQLHRFVIEAVTGAIFNIFVALQQRVPDFSIERLFFDYKQPDYVDKYQVFKPIPTQFEHSYCGIAVNLTMLNKAIPGADKLSYLQAKQACQQELDKLLQYASYAGKVQQALMQYQNTRPQLEQIAGDLKVSTRSLHRYLKEENTSFKALLDEHQALIAKECLLVYGYSVTQTASALGFVDVANFRRAFKRWYQCTPTEYVDKGGVCGAE
jgi:AraC-like DNA-binding protein